MQTLPSTAWWFLETRLFRRGSFDGSDGQFAVEKCQLSQMNPRDGIRAVELDDQRDKL